MKQLFTLALAILTISATTYAGQGGNGQGGGGVTRNGRYMTFYSAGFYTEPMEATSDEVPQLAELIHFFNTTQFVSELTKVTYASKLVPSPSRKYFKVQANSFTPEVRARLVAEYGRVMNVNVNEVALFAITDTESRTTYLFPEYFSLKPSEQKAILFHETYWLVNPRATYPEVIDAEMTFQAYIESPASAEKLVRWLRTSGTKGDVLLAGIKADLQTGAMNGLVKGNAISYVNLFGPKFIDCKFRGLGRECMPFLSTHAYTLSQKYPRSLFIKIYSEAVSSNLFEIKVRTYNTFDIANLKVNSECRELQEAFISKGFNLSSMDYSGGSVLVGPLTTNGRKCYDATMNLEFN